MDVITLLIIVAVSFFVVFFGRILTHAFKFVFYALLIALAMIFIFGISLSDIIYFVQKLIFATF